MFEKKIMPTTHAELIMGKVVEAFEIPMHLLASGRRDGDIPLARHLFCYMAYRFTPLCLTDIGKLIGNRHYSTIIHSLQVSADLIDSKHRLFIKNYNKVIQFINDTPSIKEYEKFSSNKPVKVKSTRTISLIEI